MRKSFHGTGFLAKDLETTSNKIIFSIIFKLEFS
jgi:hypothetical protein